MNVGKKCSCLSATHREWEFVPTKEVIFIRISLCRIGTDSEKRIHLRQQRYLLLLSKLKEYESLSLFIPLAGLQIDISIIFKHSTFF